MSVRTDAITPLTSLTPPAPDPTAVYARVSSLKQGEDWHTSLDTQVAECLAYAERNGLTVDPQYIVKEPYSGTTLDRPLFERLITQMERRGIRQLLMDKPDRVNRSGQQDAAYFMRRLWDANVTLSFALINFTVRPGDELAQSMFLNYALFAKLDNDQRVANVQRTRREAARSLGRYVKGNRPPYGWRMEAAQTDTHGRAMTFRLVHDPDTYPVLLRILRERQAGRSYRMIASDLTAEGVPTSAARGGVRNAAGKGWHQSSVKIIATDPINAGVVTAFRSRTVAAPPDARHARRWYRQVPVPLSEQILLPSDLVVDPPLTVEQYRWLTGPNALALRSDGKRRKAPTDRPRGQHRAGDLALGYGGLFRHAACGGTLRVTYSTYGGKEYVYYTCQRHMSQPERCPAGMSVAASVLDSLVWDAVVRDVLLVPGKLRELAEAQRQADLAGVDPNSELERLRRVQADLLADQQSLMDSVQHARDAYVRRLAEERLAQVGERIAKSEEAVEEALGRYVNEQHRQAVLTDVETLVLKHAFLLSVAPALPAPARVTFQRRVLRALGFRATVEKDADGRLDVQADLRLSAGQPGLWFVSEEEQRQWDAALAEVLGTGLRGEPLPPPVTVQTTGAQGQVRFVTVTSSPCP